MSRRRTSATGNVVGVAMTVTGGGLLLSAAVDLLEDGGDTLILAVLGAAVTGVGTGLRRTLAMPERVPPRIALRAVLVAAAVLIGVSSLTYLATGTVTRIDDALFESTAGFSTTALTVLPDLEAVDQGVLFWRSFTQWLGGFGALATIVAVLPFLGVGGPQPVGAATPLGAKHLFSPHVRHLLRGYFTVYLLGTVTGALLFLIGGMGPFDAITYAATTVSTGGFANHDRSFAHFDSALLEWFGVAGMLLGGLSLPLALQALRGKPISVLRSIELRAYLAIVLLTTLVLAWTADPGRTLHDSVRIAAFTAASAVSTTGHWVVDWSTWPSGPKFWLLVVIGVGAMSGSMGGGFRIVRALALASFVRRELLRQLVPRSVQVVRVGSSTIGEDTTDRMIGYQVLFIGTATAGLVALTLVGFDLLTALSGSVSALATFGPALGDLAPGTPLTYADHWALLILMGLMLAGRIELYPVLNGVVSLLSLPGRIIRGRWRRPRPAGRIASADEGRAP